ncbi:MAG: SufD family Fe-S cluster assembly protein, partial [Alphaproteobacteria bacterium]
MTSTRTQLDSATREAARFAGIKAALPGADLTWLAQLRSGAMEHFAAEGFPNSRIEEWKFTNLSRLAATDFTEPATGTAAPSVAALTHLAIPGTAARHMVFVNGRYRAELSDNGPEVMPITITSLGQALRDDPDGMAKHLKSAVTFEKDRARVLDSLNAAFMADGAVIRLGQGTDPTRPIHLLFLGEPETPETMGLAAVHVRNFIIAEAGAKATVVATYAGLSGGTYWTNAVTHVIAAEDAAIDHFTVQKEAAAAYHTGVTEVTLARRAQYRSFVMSVGASLARHEIAVRLNGPDSVCRLDGIALARGRQHLDNTTRVDHAEPGGTTHESYRCVADDHAHTVFQGKIRVAPHAQKTNANQSNRNL